MDSIVAIDIETTGLDPARDAIIEIGAVRFHGNRIDAEWSSLVNPQRHVPEFITALTGIDDAMLRQAPTIQEVAGKVKEFLGDSAILGHNVSFDLSFLERHIPIGTTHIIDTYELASVLLPAAGRYNLGSLGKELGILLPATHRALDDARVTHGVYVHLLEAARGLPVELIQEIVRLGEPLGWNAAGVFRGQLPASLAPRRRPADRAKAKTPVPVTATAQPPLEVHGDTLPLDVDEVAAHLEHGGTFSRHFPDFEQRPEQVQMLRAVAEALSRGRHLMVEAGTGVGKSFAYLVPAALYAVENNTRVLVSTNTINLQDQLISKDIPDLAAALGLPLRASILKGRSNYLCPRRLENLQHFGPRNLEEVRVLAKVLVWQLQNDSGDRSGINLNGAAEREVWMRLSAEDEGCSTETCIKRTGGACPFHRARAAAQSAHLLIVNHALLLSDVAAAGKVLPEYTHLIIDEGHHLESATTSALSFRITQFDFDRLVRDIGGSKAGLLGSVLATCRPALGPGELAALQQTIVHATDLAFRLDQLGREFFASLNRFCEEQRADEPATVYARQERILPSTRTLPGWDEIEIAWESLSLNLQLFLKAVSGVQSLVAQLPSNRRDDLDDLASDLATLGRRLDEAHRNLAAMISEPLKDQVYWLETRPNGSEVSLNAAPLRVGPMIENVLWHEKASVIVTSATLTTHGEFNYLRSTLGADEADELQLGSPFDYESSTLLYVANDLPEPNTREYQQALNRAIVDTARATGGRMLALFTSYAALKKTAQAITAPLMREDVLVYEQGNGASPNMLLESFKASERAVLLGTRSFWEGVDVPGQALSVVVITKLPFDVPTDPLIAARSEMYEDPFQEYYLPEAILKFRQGFGRLIRTAADRGVVAILDRRVLSKQYGRLFLESLPRCTSRQGPATQLAREAGRWLGL